MNSEAYRFILSAILILSAVALCITGKITGTECLCFFVGAVGVDPGAVARVVRKPETPPASVLLWMLLSTAVVPSCGPVCEGKWRGGPAVDQIRRIEFLARGERHLFV